MSQQQLLLIILGVIVVGVSVAVGITLFEDSSSRDANRDAVVTDLVTLATRAQQYYRRPTALGGGQGSFEGLTLDEITSKPSNANGSYVLTDIAATKCTITGTGVAVGNDGTNPVKVSVQVYGDSMAYMAFTVDN